MKEITLGELASAIGGTLQGSADRVVRGIASIESAGPDEVTFLSNVKYERHVGETKAAAVIVPDDYAGPGKSLIRCKDSYYAFRQAMVLMYGFRAAPPKGIDPRACIDASAELGKDVTVGPFAFIGPRVKVGDGTTIYPNVYVGQDVRIGRSCELFPSVTIYDGCILGDRVRIHAGTAIGQDGFGYATHNGRHEKIPEAGWVELEDDVEIGACCAIERATLGATVIGAGTKFADLIGIGHGTRMGKGCLMVSQSGIAGSTTVGNYCVFAAQSGIVGHIRIGDGVQVGAQSGVTKDVPPGIQVLGSPAAPLAETRRQMVIVSKLPEMRKTISDLVRQVEKLQARLAELEEKKKN